MQNAFYIVVWQNKRNSSQEGVGIRFEVLVSSQSHVYAYATNVHRTQTQNDRYVCYRIIKTTIA